MNDATGREIKVGDPVAFFDISRVDIGVVTELLETQVEIKVHSTSHRVRGPVRMYNHKIVVPPHRCAVLPS